MSHINTKKDPYIFFVYSYRNECDERGNNINLKILFLLKKKHIIFVNISQVELKMGSVLQDLEFVVLVCFLL
jgi:hypothetical protein